MWFKKYEEIADQRVREEGVKLLFDAMTRCSSLQKVILDGFFGTSPEETDISKLVMQKKMFQFGGAAYVASLIEG